MAPLAGQPLLSHVIRRLQAATRWLPHSPQVMVATTSLDDDDLTAAFCRRLEVACYRGSSGDVLSRYVAASADLGDEDIVIRATADNPAYCPLRTAAIVREHISGGADYTCVRGLSYVAPEVMRVGALRAMARQALDPECREHVTPYFRRDRAGFHTLFLPERWLRLRPEIRLTVDTPAELAWMDALFTALGCDRRLPLLEEFYRQATEQAVVSMATR